jgi:AcrR family transcriptional regulator
MSEPVIKYDRAMSRWEPDARGRLERAALELYVEHGFDRTTVAEIAKAAGLTERTFYRHYADKREVLFGDGITLPALLADAVTKAPEATPPIEAIAGALAAWGAVFEERRDSVLRRQAVIAANPELRERELIKLATLASAMAGALRGRGTREPAASLAAEAGVAVFRIAFERWISEPGPPDLQRVLRESFAELKAVTAGG